MFRFKYAYEQMGKGSDEKMGCWILAIGYWQAARSLANS